MSEPGTIILTVIATAAFLLIGLSWPGVRYQRRFHNAVRNFTIQITQLANMMREVGYAAERAAELMDDFGEAWDTDVVETVRSEPRS